MEKGVPLIRFLLFLSVVYEYEIKGQSFANPLLLPFVERSLGGKQMVITNNILFAKTSPVEQIVEAVIYVSFLIPVLQRRTVECLSFLVNHLNHFRFPPIHLLPL